MKGRIGAGFVYPGGPFIPATTLVLHPWGTICSRGARTLVQSVQILTPSVNVFYNGDMIKDQNRPHACVHAVTWCYLAQLPLLTGSGRRNQVVSTTLTVQRDLEIILKVNGNNGRHRMKNYQCLTLHRHYVDTGTLRLVLEAAQENVKCALDKELRRVHLLPCDPIQQTF